MKQFLGVKIHKKSRMLQIRFVLYYLVNCIFFLSCSTDYKNEDIISAKIVQHSFVSDSTVLYINERRVYKVGVQSVKRDTLNFVNSSKLIATLVLDSFFVTDNVYCKQLEFQYEISNDTISIFTEGKTRKNQINFNNRYDSLVLDDKFLDKDSIHYKIYYHRVK